MEATMTSYDRFSQYYFITRNCVLETAVKLRETPIVFFFGFCLFWSLFYFYWLPTNSIKPNYLELVYKILPDIGQP